MVNMENKNWRIFWFKQLYLSHIFHTLTNTLYFLKTQSYVFFHTLYSFVQFPGKHSDNNINSTTESLVLDKDQCKHKYWISN